MERPQRKQNRLKDYDYSNDGAYFVTICIKEKICLLWEDDKLSEYGKVVKKSIQSIPKYYPVAKIDKYVIMPDHIHLIITISNNEEKISIQTIIGQMKRWVSKQIGFSMWQKSFHDHIVRNELDYKEKWKYIEENPMKWNFEEH